MRYEYENSADHVVSGSSKSRLKNKSSLKNLETEVREMAEILNYDEIKQKYDGEWVLIAYTEIDSQFKVIRGEVIAHSPDRDPVYNALSSRNDRAVAIECFVKVPEDMGFIL